MLSNLLYILLAILILGIVIVIHELGHFIVGRLCGIGVLEFSMGMGPKLLGWTHKGTEYSVRAFPIGGYCKFEGEDEENTSPSAMNNQPVWKRFLTVFAGPAMNFVLAFVAAVILLMSFDTVKGLYPMIQSVEADSAAAQVEMLPGDVITSVNGVPVSYDTAGVETLRAAIQEEGDLSLTIDRNGEVMEMTVSPRTVTLENGAAARQIGVVFSVAYHRDTLFEAIPDAGRTMANSVNQMLAFLRNLVFKGEGINEVAGPVGTVAVVSDYLKKDSSLFLDFLFIISLNLGIMNLLPLPALDGGRLVFLTIEGIRRKPVPADKEGMVHAIGLLLFLVLAVVLVWHDLFTYVIH